jgi:hypothetical protein
MYYNLQKTFVTLLVSILLISNPLMSQNGCGTGAPPQQWEQWMTEQVEIIKANQRKGKSQVVNFTIPVIVHVIHFGEPYGTYPNIDSNQIKSQIVALNNDFGGTGAGISSVPAYFAGLVANTGIQFCLAQKDPNDVVLIERGADRKSAAANNWTSPSTASLNLQTYFQSVIIPSTIWDPTKYLNIWVSDKPTGYPLNGFATYPSNTGLSGLFGGTMGTSSNDGVWIYARAFGTTGAATAPYDGGRNATHEIGHWLGLRHTWGDGNCLSDYVNDTPWSKQAHYGCLTSTPPNLCGINQSPNGEMTMNFMDRTDDACMYMFTNDQNVRMQIAMSQCPNRNQLGTHNKCTVVNSSPTSSAVANFNLGGVQCLNTPFYPLNTSSGNPNPSFVWSSSPAGSFGPSATQANPAITIGTPGTYTITLVATNSLSSSTHTQIVTVTGTCAPSSLCLDSIRMMKNVDTLQTYKVANNNLNVGCQTGFSGYLTGTNCYKDKEFAQYYPPTSYSNSIQYPQVNSVIVLFDSVGTNAVNPATQITCRVYGGSAGTGPVSTIGLGKSDSLGKIVASPKVSSVTYIGKPGFIVPNTKIIPFKFDFVTPIVINAASGFYVSVNTPLFGGDSINIFSNTKYNTTNDSSAWYLNFNGNWRTYRYFRSSKIQLAIIPQITCSPVVGIRELPDVFASNINIIPNPGNGKFNLLFTFPAQHDQLNIKVYSMVGQTVAEQQINNVSSNMFEVDLTSYPEGVYFAEINSGNQKCVKKIVITK